MKISLSHNKRGDTIVEVVLAMTIIAVVLGSASALANRSTKSLQTSQEHATALRLAQTQLERIKDYIPDPGHKIELNDAGSTIRKADGYCMVVDAGNITPKVATNAGCVVNALGNATTDSIQYRIKVTSLYTTPELGYKAKITVEWDTLQNRVDKVELTYRTYDKLLPTIAPDPRCDDGSLPPCKPLQVAVDTLSVKFPAWHLGAANAGTRKSTITVQNPSPTRNINLTEALVQGLNASSFKINTNNCKNKALTPAATCTIIVEFEPPAGGSNNTHGNAGNKVANLVVNSSDSETLEASVSLSGMTYSNVLASGDVLQQGDQLRSYEPSCYNDAETCGVFVTLDEYGLIVARSSTNPTVNLWRGTSGSGVVGVSKAPYRVVVNGNGVVGVYDVLAALSWYSNGNCRGCKDGISATATAGDYMYLYGDQGGILDLKHANGDSFFNIWRK